MSVESEKNRMEQNVRSVNKELLEVRQADQNHSRFM